MLTYLPDSLKVIFIIKLHVSQVLVSEVIPKIW